MEEKERCQACGAVCSMHTGTGVCECAEDCTCTHCKGEPEHPVEAPEVV